MRGDRSRGKISTSFWKTKNMDKNLETNWEEGRKHVGISRKLTGSVGRVLLFPREVNRPLSL